MESHKLKLNWEAWKGHFPMNLHMNLHIQYPQLDTQSAMKWIWNNLFQYLNRKLDMLFDMEMTLSGFRRQDTMNEC